MTTIDNVFFLQLLMVVSIVLERNPELEFQETVDLDRLVKEAFSDFQRDHSKTDGVEKKVGEYLANYAIQRNSS